MDASSLDNVARAIASPSRRALLAGLSAALLNGVVDARAKKHKKKRCKKKKRCGKGCCGATSCFAETVNDVDGQPLSFACCPANSFCKSELPNWRDQCCYPDENCDPQLPNKDPFIDSICCRPCGGTCCPSSFECVDDVCEPANTARLPRYRR